MHVGKGLWENRSLYRRKGFDLQRCEDSEHKLTLSYMQICYATFNTYLVMQPLASKIKTHTQCKQNDILKHGGQLLLLPQCVQLYCIAGLIHPGITSV